MDVRWIVMRPMHDRRAPWIVNHLAAHFDAVSGPDGAPRRDADVVDYLNRTGVARDIKGFVHPMRPRTVKVVRCGCDDGLEIDSCGIRTDVSA